MSWGDDPGRVDPPECYVSRLSDHLTEPDDDYREAQRLARTDPDLYPPMSDFEIDQAREKQRQIDAILATYERLYNKGLYRTKKEPI